MVPSVLIVVLDGVAGVLEVVVVDYVSGTVEYVDAVSVVDDSVHRYVIVGVHYFEPNSHTVIRNNIPEGLVSRGTGEYHSEQVLGDVVVSEGISGGAE